MTLDQIYEKLKMEHAASIFKHGKWKDLESTKQIEAINDEFLEWRDAWFIGDVNGEHGEIAELVDLMNVCARRIMFLSGENQ